MYDGIIAPVRPFAGIQLSDSASTTSSLPARGNLDTAKAIADIALEVLGELDPVQRQQVSHQVDAVEWQHWINTHPNILRHGLLLEDMTEAQRQRVIALMRASLCESGFDQARNHANQRTARRHHRSRPGLRRVAVLLLAPRLA